MIYVKHLFFKKRRRAWTHFKSAVMCLLFALIAIQAFAQTNTTVTGTVRDASGEALPAVSVALKGTTIGTTTDVQGRYTIKVNGTGGTLVFSIIGFATAELNIEGRTTIDVTLKESEKSLSEVVVIGYGTAKRKDLTGPVSSVTGKDIAATPVPNIAQAMQGKLPGVNITAQDGRPNANISIRIRGGGSISQSNQPLVLIDGQPGNINDIAPDQVESIDVLKDASTTAIYGSRGANGVVLVTTKSAKPGRTTVSYNGYVKFNTPVKYLEALGPYDYLRYVWANAAANGVAYQTPFEKLYGLGANAGANTGGIESYRDLAIDDIQRTAYNNSTSSNHSLTLSGGTDKTKILFNVNYTDEQGMKINSYLKRANAQLKITQKITDNLTFDLNTRYTNSPVMSDEGTTSGSGSILSTSYRFRPISIDHILGDKNAIRTGNIEQYGKASMWDAYNPAARIGDYEPLATTQNLIALGSLNWVIVKGLTYHTDLNLNKGWSNRKYWSGAIYNNYMDDVNNKKLYAGAVDYRKGDSWGLRWANTLSYEFSLKKDHKFTVLAGQEVFDSGGTELSIQANRFPSNYDKETAFAQINQYDATVGSATFASNVDFPDRLISYFGRANYSFLDKYLLSFTFRADASSKFAPSNRWGYFPAVAAGWKITEESFMKNITWLESLKLRASYGAVGNNQINPAAWTQNWTSVSDQRLQYAIGHVRQSAYQVSGQLANPNLKWETTITRDIGTDFSLFKGRLSGTIDVYHNTTKDLLMITSLTGITGFTSTTQNIGQTSNKGVEFSLTGTVFQTKDWRITAGGNISFNKNNVDALANNVTGLYGASWAGSATYPASDYILKVGNPVGLVRGLTYDGFYTPADFNYNNGIYTLKPGVVDIGSFVGVTHGLTSADKPASQYAYPGMPKYKDINSDGKIDDKDLDVIGKAAPKHIGGVNLSVSYKNIDLGMFFNWSYGNQVYNANKLATLFGPKEAGVYENKLAIMNNAYKIYDVVGGQLVRLKTPEQLNAANVNANLPLAYNEGGVTSTLGIEDGSFLRLNTLTVGYSLPKSVLSKIKVSSLRIYGSMYNVFTITNYSGLDPEVNTNLSQNNAIYPTLGLDFGSYPRARSFILGLNLNF